MGEIKLDGTVPEMQLIPQDEPDGFGYLSVYPTEFCEFACSCLSELGLHIWSNSVTVSKCHTTAMLHSITF